MVKLSVYLNSFTQNITKKLKFIEKNNIRFIELEMPEQKDSAGLQLYDLRNMLNDFGVKVSLVRSSIGRININEPYLSHLNKYRNIVDFAAFLGALYIQIYSYYLPHNKDSVQIEEEIVNRMKIKIDILKNLDISLLHTNQIQTFGRNPAKSVKLAKAINSSKFRLLYDPVYYVRNFGIRNNSETCWEAMKPYVFYVRVHDWKITKEKICLPGKGDAQIKELFTDMAKMNYDQFLTLDSISKDDDSSDFFDIDVLHKKFEKTKELALETGLDFKQ